MLACNILYQIPGRTRARNNLCLLMQCLTTLSMILAFGSDQQAMHSSIESKQISDGGSAVIRCASSPSSHHVSLFGLAAASIPLLGGRRLRGGAGGPPDYYAVLGIPRGAAASAVRTRTMPITSTRTRNLSQRRRIFFQVHAPHRNRQPRSGGSPAACK